MTAKYFLELIGLDNWIRGASALNLDGAAREKRGAYVIFSLSGSLILGCHKNVTKSNALFADISGHSTLLINEY